MKYLLVAAAVLAAPVAGHGQPTLAPITATPLLPPTVEPPVMTQPQMDQAQPAPPPVPSGPLPIPSTWVPQSTAQLQVLDKINAQNAMLTVKVGQDAKYGSLNIQVQACDVHPSDQPRDSAAYLTITDSHSDAPGFRGWMLADNPSLSMLQNPIYDVRVVGCRS